MSVNDVPWIENGVVNLERVPIELLKSQAREVEFDRFNAACSVLGNMASFGRKDAEEALLQRMLENSADLKRMEAIVAFLPKDSSGAVADTLVAELKRVKSSNTTRRYRAAVLRALKSMDEELAFPRLLALSNDQAFSPRLRARFREGAEGVQVRSCSFSVVADSGLVG